MSKQCLAMQITTTLTLLVDFDPSEHANLEKAIEAHKEELMWQLRSQMDYTASNLFGDEEIEIINTDSMKVMPWGDILWGD